MKLKKLFKKILDTILPEQRHRSLAKNISTNDLQIFISFKMSEKTLCFSLFEYRDLLIRNIIRNIKYKGCIRSTRKVAGVLYPYLIDEIAEKYMFGEKNIPILIPIPLFKKREKERGFNQSERICQALQKIDEDRSFTLKNDILKRLIDTKSQTKMKSRKERKENIRNAFEVINKEGIENKVIVLIDDVITTGATMHEARKTLLNSGAKDVICFALARG